MRRTTAPAALVALVVVAVGAGCSGQAGQEVPDSPGGIASVTSTAEPGGEGEYAAAYSETREDSVYPQQGDPVVDALHYDLDLTWDPTTRTLTGEETLTFRATAASAEVPLDLSSALAVESVTVDGEPAEFTAADDDLRIAAPVEADAVHEVALTYAGTPAPTPAPSQREDFTQGLGWNITDTGETWTLQEPFGAFTWFAVNDQPADKAFYDFTLTTPLPWEGVANGELVEETTEAGMRTHRWHLAEPASSYLITVAFGDFQRTDLTSASGVPIQVWTDAAGTALPGDLDYTPEAIDWLENLLGPYPFDTFGVLVVDNDSGMETQTMITLGNNPYSLSAAVLVHEGAHHWYGDSVSPADWSDVWMNEGMAMYLQGMWEAEQEGIPVEAKMDEWARFEDELRAAAGPPAAYDPTMFGDGNIYYGPALMWQELREMVGDDAFFEVVREWPASQENGNADREEYWSWLEEQTGEELTSFFEDWLLDAETPDRD